jgi:hypothetical protein
MKRAWIFIGIILLVAGVVFEEKHRAETIKNHLPPVAMRDPAAAPYVVKANNFSDYVDLWGNPWVETDDPDLTYAKIASGSDPKPASVEKFKSRLDYHPEPVLTVQDRQVGYSLLDFGGFKLNVNLKPAYSTPDALLPTRIDPGISGSFSF